MSDWKLLNTSTASGASSVEFTDLTGYKIFKFVFVDMHPATTGDNYGHFQFNCSTDGSTYNVTKTTTFFWAMQNESGSDAVLEYSTNYDLAQSGSYQALVPSIGMENDESCAGELFLFNPTSTTYVKHFYGRGHGYGSSDYAYDTFPAGYFNTTSALSSIDFKFSTANIENGTIKQYGLVAT